MREAAELFAQAERCRCGGRVSEALTFYDYAEKRGYAAGECKAGKWTCYMLAGRWDLAWAESDRIAELGITDPHQYWGGSDWSGKDVLVRCLHGLGDTLQFVRYVPLLRSCARSVTIEAQPKLQGLLAQAGLADSVITWGDNEPDWQVQMEVNELPRIFRTTENTIPSRDGYLRAEARRCAGEGVLHVGLVWAASDFDASRNVPFALLQSILDIPGICFYSLQAGEGWSRSLPDQITNLSERDTPIERIAAEMVGLDLIVTVDTMNAHLAGALGRPTWTMLPTPCDWRWMLHRCDTPWYRSMRLFRQPSPGEWTAVVEQVRTELVAISQQWARRRQAG